MACMTSELTSNPMTGARTPLEHPMLVSCVRPTVPCLQQQTCSWNYYNGTRCQAACLDTRPYLQLGSSSTAHLEQSTAYNMPDCRPGGAERWHSLRAGASRELPRVCHGDLLAGLAILAS